VRIRTLARTIRLSPQEDTLLTRMSQEEHLSPGTLLKKLVLDGIGRQRVEWACAAYKRGELGIAGAARYAGLNVYEMLDELKRRNVQIVSSEQFLDGLDDLAELYNLPELGDAASQARTVASP
jgi:predicted HTH domain antitoxin